METLEDFKKELDKLVKIKEEFLEKLRKQFPNLLKTLFDKSDKIESIGWTQYTPWFNDGDACTFSVHTDCLYINGEYDEDIEELDWRIPYYLKGHKDYQNVFEDNPKADLEFYNQVEEFKEFLGSIPDDIYLDLFGDHVEVTVYKNGSIDVSECDHD